MSAIHITTEPIIKVGISLAKSIEIELLDDYFFHSNQIEKGKYRFELNKNEIVGNGLSGKIISLQSNSPTASFKINSVTIGIGFHWEQQEDQIFEGNLSLIIENQNIRIINEIPVEKYLVSVISSEMSAMNDLNLLKTHAIVSRSWLLAQLYNPKQKIASSNNINEHIKWYDREDHLLFDVCADDHCQRYQGVTKVISENAKTAVAATAGKVLSSENEICDARFSKCCGGITEDFYHVWQAEKKSYLTSIIDSPNTQSIANLSSLEFIQSAPAAYCNTNDRKVLQQVLIDFDQKTADFYRWTIQYSQDEISALIRQKSGIDFGEIIDLIPVERGASHRIIRLKIVGTKKSLTIGKELEIRKWLSSSHLYSSAFLVKKTTKEQNQIPTSFQLTGAGWGHGVGMCQIGAAVMSQQGFSELEILQHYFKNSNILQLY